MNSKGPNRWIPRGIIFPWLVGSVMFCFSLYAPAEGKPKEEIVFTGATIKTFQWRSLGPAFFSGRVTDIAVPKGKQHTIYCAAASGSLWKTTNNGITWEPIFDNHGTGSMGAIALADADTNIVWVGTGEVIAGSHSAWEMGCTSQQMLERPGCTGV